MLQVGYNIDMAQIIKVKANEAHRPQIDIRKCRIPTNRAAAAASLISQDMRFISALKLETCYSFHFPATFMHLHAFLNLKPFESKQNLCLYGFT
jgi:hypothetical protein